MTFVRFAGSSVLTLILSVMFLGVAGAIPAPKLQRINAIEAESLDFGRLAVLSRRGLVRIRPNGQRSVSGGVVDLGGHHGPAIISVTGAPNRPFIVLAPGFTPLRRPFPGPPLVVTRWETSPARIGRFSEYGHAEIRIGGELRVNIKRPYGRYKAFPSVWIAYW